MRKKGLFLVALNLGYSFKFSNDPKCTAENWKTKDSEAIHVIRYLQ